MESQFEFGSRVGVRGSLYTRSRADVKQMWRLLRLFEKHNHKITIYAVAQAFEKNPQVSEACDDAGHEIASHGMRWIDYRDLPAEQEEDLIRQAVASFQKMSKKGKAPVGWYYGRPSPRSRALISKVCKDLGLELLYNSDNYA